MSTISAVEFNRDAAAILRKVQEGEQFIVTDDGKPVARIEPVVALPSPASVPTNSLLELCRLGEQLIPPGPQEKLTNEDIDRIVYGI